MALEDGAQRGSLQMIRMVVTFLLQRIVAYLTLKKIYPHQLPERSLCPVALVIHSHNHGRIRIPYVPKFLPSTRAICIGCNHSVSKRFNPPSTLSSATPYTPIMLTGRRSGSTTRILGRRRPRIPISLVIARSHRSNNRG